MPVYVFVVIRWAPGGSTSFGALLNSGIHVLMYFYYFVASFGPRFQKHLWLGQYLTLLQVHSPESYPEESIWSLDSSLQMLQFVIIIAHCGVNIVGLVDCGYPWQMSLITSCLIILFLCLFANFYIQKYKRRPSPQDNQHGMDPKKVQWQNLNCKLAPNKSSILCFTVWHSKIWAHGKSEYVIWLRNENSEKNKGVKIRKVLLIQ